MVRLLQEALLLLPPPAWESAGQYIYMVVIITHSLEWPEGEKRGNVHGCNHDDPHGECPRRRCGDEGGRGRTDKDEWLSHRPQKKGLQLCVKLEGATHISRARASQGTWKGKETASTYNPGLGKIQRSPFGD